VKLDRTRNENNLLWPGKVTPRERKGGKVYPGYTCGREDQSAFRTQRSAVFGRVLPAGNRAGETFPYSLFRGVPVGVVSLGGGSNEEVQGTLTGAENQPALRGRSTEARSGAPGSFLFDLGLLDHRVKVWGPSRPAPKSAKRRRTRGVNGKSCQRLMGRRFWRKIENLFLSRGGGS